MKDVVIQCNALDKLPELAALEHPPLEMNTAVMVKGLLPEARSNFDCSMKAKHTDSAVERQGSDPAGR